MSTFRRKFFRLYIAFLFSFAKDGLQQDADDSALAFVDDSAYGAAHFLRTSVPNNTKSNAARIPCGKCGGYIGGKLSFLPGEDLQTGSRKSESRSNNELQEVSRGHSTLIFFQGKGRTIVSLKYRPEGGQCVESRIPRKRGLPAKR